MSLSATLFGRDSAIFRITNVLGLGSPGWLDKKFGAPETEGPRLEDLSVQTSTYGTDIPRLYGTVAMSGNLIWLENGKLKEVVKKKKSGGKGGGELRADQDLHLLRHLRPGAVRRADRRNPPNLVLRQTDLQRR